MWCPASTCQLIPVHTSSSGAYDVLFWPLTAFHFEIFFIHRAQSFLPLPTNPFWWLLLCTTAYTFNFFIFILKMVYVCARECRCPRRELDTVSCLFCLHKRGGTGMSCAPLCSQRVPYRNQTHTLNQTLFRIFQKNIPRTDSQHLFKKHKHYLMIVKSQMLISLHSPSRSLLFLSSDKCIIASLESIQLKPSNLWNLDFGQSLWDYWPMEQYQFINLVGVWGDFSSCWKVDNKFHPICAPEGKLCQWELGPRTVVLKILWKGTFKLQTLFKGNF